MAKKQKTSCKTKKATYRIRNWSQYNQSLVQRGSITLWIDDDVLVNWHPEAPAIRARGGQIQYSDQAIECVLMIKAVYRLPYRQSVGFTQSLIELMGADVRVPDYSTVCKRSVELNVDLGIETTDTPKHIVLDSTGLKIYGEGEWKVRQHGYSKRRTWRKLHLSVNTATQELEAVVLSEASVDDAEAGKTLLDDTVGDIDQVDADARMINANSMKPVRHVGLGKWRQRNGKCI